MTVKELIEYLKQCPDDMLVVFFDDNEGDYDNIRVEQDEITANYGSTWGTIYTGEAVVITAKPY